MGGLLGCTWSGQRRWRAVERRVAEGQRCGSLPLIGNSNTRSNNNHQRVGAAGAEGRSRVRQRPSCGAAGEAACGSPGRRVAHQVRQRARAPPPSSTLWGRRRAPCSAYDAAREHGARASSWALRTSARARVNLAVPFDVVLVTMALALSVELWTPDEQRGACMGCRTPFSFFVWKHHCRFCGEVFCDPCRCVARCRRARCSVRNMVGGCGLCFRANGC